MQPSRSNSTTNSPHVGFNRKHASRDVKWIGVWHHYLYGLSFRDIGEMLFRHHSTVQSWWKHFQRTGQPYESAKKREKTLGLLELDYIYRLILDNGTLYMDEIVDDLQSVYGVTVSLSTLCRAMYHDLHLTRKKITKFNREKSILLQQQYWMELRVFDATPERLIFIDETSKDARDAARLYGR